MGAALALGLVLGAPAVRAASPGVLQFDVAEGRNLNSFLRSGPVAAHLVLRNGEDPRLLVAFPAGNSGVGLWFVHKDAATTWRLASPPRPLTRPDEKGRSLHGMVVDVEARGGDLAVKQAVLSSVRVLRDYQYSGQAPEQVLIAPKAAGDRLVWARDRLDGAAGYRLSIQVTHGALRDGRLAPGTDGRIGLRIEALTGETPLTPLGGEALLNPAAKADRRARNTLNFLSYREKLLAGSWRFDTYFGRDTLMSTRLLMPVLQPAAIEGALRSVAARLSPEGEVAHEEGIGEFAVLDHLKHDAKASDAPEFDYGMIDGGYMLAPVAAAWLSDDPRGRARAAAFLASPSGRAGAPEETVGAALLRNLRRVASRTRPFAEAPSAAHLIAINPGRRTGQWRDSDTGLGGGIYPYDVNAVFAPAALAAIDRLTRSGLLDPYLDAADREAFAKAGEDARVWRTRAPTYFEAVAPVADARARVAAYARAEGVPAAPALAALDHGPARFHALSLNADGSPVRVIHSDEAFDLLFGAPDPEALDQEVETLMRPFPAGPMTPIGLLVADPVYADAQQQALFTRSAYHGLVVWSWQQAVLAAGLQRQLARADLPARVRGRLVAAQRRLWTAIAADRAVANSELWSWTFKDGRYQIVPFGAGEADADESNAAQLWSSVFLALKPPAKAR